MIRLLTALLLLLTAQALAVEPGERLADPALEARARAISTELRCLVCQNESIDDSHAGLARDIRVLVRERLTKGDTDAQAVQSIVDRYGDFVLLRPPVKPATWLLWFGPAALLVAGFAGTFAWLRRRAPDPAVAMPLTEDDKRRLDRLLKDDAP
jgi:cytochrome c-type biogenesis protein CcmH